MRHKKRQQKRNEKTRKDKRKQTKRREEKHRELTREEKRENRREERSRSAIVIVINFHSYFIGACGCSKGCVQYRPYERTTGRQVLGCIAQESDLFRRSTPLPVAVDFDGQVVGLSLKLVVVVYSLLQVIGQTS